MIGFLLQHQFWVAVGISWIFSAAVSALTGLKVLVPLLLVKTRPFMFVFWIASFLVVTPVAWTEFSADHGVSYFISDSKIRYDSAGNLVGKWNSHAAGNIKMKGPPRLVASSLILPDEPWRNGFRKHHGLMSTVIQTAIQFEADKNRRLSCPHL